MKELVKNDKTRASALRAALLTLALCALFALLPMGVDAAVGSVSNFDELKTFIESTATAGDNSVTLSAGTYTATSDITVPSGVNITLELNGQTLDMQSHSLINNGGLLEINHDASGTGTVTGTSASADSGVIKLGVSGRLKVNSGTVSNTGEGNAIYNAGAGNVLITGGTVSAINGNAISIVGPADEAGGAIAVSGGTVQATGTGHAIYNDSGRIAESTPVSISGGTVSAVSGCAIYNTANVRGIVSISEPAGDTLITSANTAKTKGGEGGTVFLQSEASLNTNQGCVIENTGDGCAILHKGAGSIDIGGGTVSALNAPAVIRAGAGGLTISQQTDGSSPKVTSANTATDGAASAPGTVYIGNTVTAYSTVISSATVENTSATAGYAVYNAGATQILVEKNTGDPSLTNPVNPVVSSRVGAASVGGAIYLAGGAANNAILTVKAGEVKDTVAGNAIYNAGSGYVKVSGGTVSAAGNHTLYNAAAGRVEVSADTDRNGTVHSGTVSGADGKYAIYNNSTGYIAVIDGRVGGAPLVTNASASTPGGAIYLGAAGANLSVTAGRVQDTGGGYAIYNAGAGGVSVGGGTVSANTGTAVYSHGLGTVTVSGSANVTSTGGDAIYLNAGTAGGEILQVENGTVTAGASGRAIYNNGAGAVRLLLGSTVQSTGSGNAIENASTGAVTVSDAVSANTGCAIYNSGAGLVTVSGSANVSSANTSNASGTVYLNAGASGSTVLTMSGGTISNTAAGNAIYNAGAGDVSLAGGTTSAASGCGIYNCSAGKIKLEAAGAIIKGDASALGGAAAANAVPVVSSGVSVSADTLFTGAAAKVTSVTASNVSNYKYLKTVLSSDVREVVYRHWVGSESGYSGVAGEKVIRPADPTRQDYIFEGWYKDEACVNAWDFDVDTIKTEIGVTTVLYAKWRSAYDVALSPSPLVLPAKTIGYSPAPVTVTVANIGALATGDLAVSLGGANPASFTLSSSSVGSIAFGASGSFDVSAAAGLEAGTYSAVITVSNAKISKTVNVSFTVNPLSLSVTGCYNFPVKAAYNDAVFTISNPDMGTAFNASTHFNSATLDGSPLALGTVGAPGADGSIANGSIILTINRAKLNSLGAGNHTLVVTLGGIYAGKTVSSTITVRPAPAPVPSGDGRANPSTGAQAR